MSATTMARSASEEQRAPAGGSSRRPRLRFAVTAALALGAVVVLAWVVAFSSVLGMRTVTVRGTHLLTAAQVRAAAAIARGTPLVRIDTAAIARRVEALAEVASVHVDTSFPSTVAITVVERRPVGYVRAAGQAVLVDRTGAEYRPVADAPRDQPLLVVSGSRQAVAAVATVAQALPASLRAGVRSIQALDPSSITLVLRSGEVVRWGSPDRNADKARIVAALVHRADSSIDVTDPDQPFTR